MSTANTYITYLCNELVHVIYSGVSGQCFHTTAALTKCFSVCDFHVLFQYTS